MIRGVNRGTDDRRSRESLPIVSVDTLQKDDVDGAIAIYGAAAPADTLQPAFHPRRSW